jgi:hypothetical protein
VIRLYADTPYASARGWDTPDHDREPRFRWSPQLAVLAELGYELSTVQRHRLTAEASAHKIGLSRSYASQLSAMGHHYPLLNHIAGDLATEVWWDCRPVRAAQLRT